MSDDADEFALKMLQRAKARSIAIAESLNKDKENSSSTSTSLSVSGLSSDGKIDALLQKYETPRKAKEVQDHAVVNERSRSRSRSPLKGSHKSINVEEEKSEIIASLSGPLKGALKKVSFEFTEEQRNGDSEEESLMEEEEMDVEAAKEEDKGAESSDEEFRTPIGRDPDRSTRGGVSVETKRNLSQLGKLYGEAPIASPVHSHSVLEKTPTESTSVFVTNSASRRTRLHALAKTINNWEDDTSYHAASPTSRFSFNPKKPHSPTKSFLGVQDKSMVRGSLNTNKNIKSKLTTMPKAEVDNSVETLDSSVVSSVSKVEPSNSNLSLDESEANVGNNLDVRQNGSKSLASIISGKWKSTEDLVDSGSKNCSLQLDDSIVKALEAQGYVQSDSKTKLMYEFRKERSRSCSPEKSPRKYTLPSPQKPPSATKRAGSPVRPTPIHSSPSSAKRGSTSFLGRDMELEEDEGKPTSVVKSRAAAISKAHEAQQQQQQRKIDVPIVKASVASKTAMFESKADQKQTIPEKDPAELSVAERMKLFEKQDFLKPPFPQAAKQAPLSARIPKNFAPRDNSPKKDNANQSFMNLKGTVGNQRKMFETSQKETARAIPIVQEEDSSSEDEVMSAPSGPPPPPPPMPTSSMLSSPRKNLEDNESKWSMRASPKDMSRRSISLSPERSPKRNSASPSKRRSVSPKHNYPGSRDVKRIKVNEPKDGRMYPSLTDIEATETETEAENYDDNERYEPEESMESEASIMSGASLGTHIEKEAKKNSPVRRNIRYRPSIDRHSTTSFMCRHVDALMDEALEGQDFTLDTVIESQLDAPAASTPVHTKIEEENEESGGTITAEGSKQSWRLAEELAALEEESLVRLSRQSALRNSTTASSSATLIANSACIEKSVLEGHSPRPHSSASHSRSSSQDSDPIVASSPLKLEDSPAPLSQVPLLHTVSFYRKQQSQNATSTLRTQKRGMGTVEEERLPSPNKELAKQASINEQIKKLEDEVMGHQKNIAQVSKALNLCKSTVEFSESTENVECEKVLLIATEKRMAAISEIHRLKTDGALGIDRYSPSKADLGPSSNGNLSISEIRIQLKKEIINRACKEEAVLHFFALLKYRTHVEHSSLVSFGHGVSSPNIHGGVLSFPNTFNINSLEPDFKVRLEIYVLKTMKEFLPHEAKYHIKKQETKGKSLLTPKKNKSLKTPVTASPAGPNAVRTSNFRMEGFLSIDISTLQRSHWNLERVLYTSPLEGSLSMRMNCSAVGGIEERGFLTLFDDVSGFGAWRRRWCKLTPSTLAYWMYPDDEMTKEPIGEIALRYCVTTRVGPCNRDVCARMNTFLIVTTREVRDDDAESLTTAVHGDYTAIRHLMSADTKEERDVWVRQFNRALANLRAWDPHARSPDDTLF